MSILLYTSILVFFLFLMLQPVLLWTDIVNLSIDKQLKLFFSISLTVLFFSSVSTTIVYAIQQWGQQSLIDQIQWLAKGKYTQMAIERATFSLRIFFPQFEKVQEGLGEISSRTNQLLSEMQELNMQPKYLGNETKEEIVEAERHRIARELHDSVSQQLFASMMLLSAINEQTHDAPEMLQKQLRMVGKIINESQSEMRALLLHLRPISLEFKTLKEGIEALLMELKTKIQCTIIWDLDETSLPIEVENHLFRIVQEVLSNTLRHANATQLEVYLKELKDTVVLKIVDNGIGFDMNKTHMGSYGLLHIKERAAALGGTTRIISFPNQGTSVELKIPLQNDKKVGVEHDKNSIS